MRMSK